MLATLPSKLALGLKRRSHPVAARVEEDEGGEYQVTDLPIKIGSQSGVWTREQG